ncbi:MAG TPA: hypothetical protein V6C86_07135 [Oculatellaceae cyanobacterium]
MISPSQLSTKTNSTEVVSVTRTLRKNWWLTGLSVICWQVIALLFVEAVLFTAGIGEEEIFKFDPKLGFQHFPNKIVTWRSEGYARSYFGPDGLRESNVSMNKASNAYRVVLLGDSLVESLQVPLEKSWGQLLEKSIGPVDGKRVEVLNFGNSGYSTTQDCLALEGKVFKYHPDLVVLGYSSRDMMENWSPPDETVSNVRPVALKLPGRPLIIDSSPVVSWLKSPRARFLQSIEWFRQNSRVWGIISATELQLSMKDPTVKAILSFATNPSRSVRGWIKSVRGSLGAVGSIVAKTPVLTPATKSAPVLTPLSTAVSATPAATLVSVRGVTKVATADTMKAKSSVSSTAAKAVAPQTSAANLEQVTSPITATVAQDPSERNSYTRLIAATMGGLIERMHADCVQHNVRFMVLGMPSRADLAPYPGAAPTSDLSYEDETVIVRKLCAQDDVPFVDGNSPARRLPTASRQAMFFSAHLAPPGHVYLSQQLIPAVRQQLSSASASMAGVEE